MDTTRYLYGIDAKEFMYMPYHKALRYKLEKGKALYEKLYYSDTRPYEVALRLHRVFKAIRHNEKLLRELENELRPTKTLYARFKKALTHTRYRIRALLY